MNERRRLPAPCPAMAIAARATGFPQDPATTQFPETRSVRYVRQP